ncbi:MAG: electron transport complex subunit RsxC [Firmicutes bacterium]|nr:electron transport complex subunit RsxC [[Eubacterium] siraeum]MCM1487214.1 electron transport complex subunit RsxC [Bacillota bacterium]
MKLHSVKLPHHKAAAEASTSKPLLPPKVVISMSQHGGVPCTPLVQVGDEVKTGQLIGSSEAVISSPVHASVTGKVTEITSIVNIAGKRNTAVVIETASRQEIHESVKPPQVTDRTSFIEAVKNSGSVGLGGAGFPTYVKLNFDPKTNKVDTLLINAAECEPYITSDYRAIMESAPQLINGIKLIMKYLEIPSAYIGVEADKSKAIALLSELCAKEQGINVKKLPSSYPQGAEKIMIYNVTGRVLQEGELPSAAGCLVMNCSSVIFINDYIKTGMPLVSRRITIDGNIVNKPSNIIVPVGTQLSEIIKLADLRKKPDRVIFGGPMMGSSVYDPETPIMKTNNAVLFFEGAVAAANPTPCIRCGRCVRACSLNLMPTELESAYDAKDIDRLKKLKVNLCMNCGACSFVCPAKRNLSEKNQLAKIMLRNGG